MKNCIIASLIPLLWLATLVCAEEKIDIHSVKEYPLNNNIHRYLCKNNNLHLFRMKDDSVMCYDEASGAILWTNNIEGATVSLAWAILGVEAKDDILTFVFYDWKSGNRLYETNATLKVAPRKIAPYSSTVMYEDSNIIAILRVSCLYIVEKKAIKCIKIIDFPWHEAIINNGIVYYCNTRGGVCTISAIYNIKEMKECAGTIAVKVKKTEVRIDMCGGYIFLTTFDKDENEVVIKSEIIVLDEEFKEVARKVEEIRNIWLFCASNKIYISCIHGIEYFDITDQKFVCKKGDRIYAMAVIGNRFLATVRFVEDWKAQIYVVDSLDESKYITIDAEECHGMQMSGVKDVCVHEYKKPNSNQRYCRILTICGEWIEKMNEVIEKEYKGKSDGVRM